MQNFVPKMKGYIKFELSYYFYAFDLGNKLTFCVNIGQGFNPFQNAGSGPPYP
jgi:hypothetical protein